MLFEQNARRETWRQHQLTDARAKMIGTRVLVVLPGVQTILARALPEIAVSSTAPARRLAEASACLQLLRNSSSCVEPWLNSQ